MRWKGADGQRSTRGRRSGQAEGQTSSRGRIDRRVDGRGATLSGRADESGQWADKRTEVDWLCGQANGVADEQTRWLMGGRRRTGADGFPKGKTPKLTRQLMWPLEIQCGRPWVTVQTDHLPPPSR